MDDIGIIALLKCAQNRRLKSSGKSMPAMSVKSHSISCTMSRTWRKWSTIVERHRRVSRCQKILIQLLNKAYKDNVKGMIEDDVFVVLVNSFRKERSYLKSREQVLEDKTEAAQKT